MTLAIDTFNPCFSMALIRLVFWTALFLLSTFAFTVLFEHGPTNFSKSCKEESAALRAMFGKDIKRKGDESDKLSPPPNR